MSDQNLLNRLRSHAAESPDRPAYIEACGRTLSYGDLMRRVDDLTVKLGDTPAFILQCGNQPEFAGWFFAAHAAGVELMPLPCGTSNAEVSRFANRAGISHIVAATGELCLISDADAQGITTNRKSKPASDGRGGVVLVSSGSTAEPSLVRRNARSLDAVARNVAESVGMAPDDRVLATVPLAHSYGFEHGLLGPLWAGATILLGPGLEWASLRQQLDRKPTILPAVPAMIEMLPKAAGHSDAARAIRSMRSIYSAGAPLPPEARKAFQSTFSQRVGQVYGMSEIGSVTFNDPAAADFDPATVGRAMTDVSIRILDATSGEGEVVVRATSMFEGYVDQTAELVDGHLLTGDLGSIDSAGRLTITGRKRLLIETGGHKVNPLEIEAAIRTHPAVDACVVLPVRQTATSNRLRAIVVPSEQSAPPTPAEIRDYVRSRLARWKVPRHVELRESLPLTASGKIARAELEAS